MKQKITETLRTKRGYQAKGVNWLADYFGCSPRTVMQCINTLKENNEWRTNR